MIFVITTHGIGVQNLTSISNIATLISDCFVNYVISVFKNQSKKIKIRLV